MKMKGININASNLIILNFKWYYFLGLHFHLSATINAVGDIPLVPALSTGSSSNSNKNNNFVLHWMNNKEMEFSLQVKLNLELNHKNFVVLSVMCDLMWCDECNI